LGGRGANHWIVGSLSFVEFLAGIPMMQGSDLYNFQGGTQTYGLVI
jgi:hypothetical protein